MGFTALFIFCLAAGVERKSSKKMEKSCSVKLSEFWDACGAVTNVNTSTWLAAQNSFQACCSSSGHGEAMCASLAGSAFASKVRGDDTYAGENCAELVSLREAHEAQLARALRARAEGTDQAETMLAQTTTGKQVNCPPSGDYGYVNFKVPHNNYKHRFVNKVRCGGTRERSIGGNWNSKGTYRVEKTSGSVCEVTVKDVKNAKFPFPTAACVELCPRVKC